MSKVQFLSAHVAQPNTPESDAQREVMHIVHGTVDGVRMQARVMATDPMHAIDLAHKGLVHWTPAPQEKDEW